VDRPLPLGGWQQEPARRTHLVHQRIGHMNILPFQSAPTCRRARSAERAH
jgi:hypothetical protein